MRRTSPILPLVLLLVAGIGVPAASQTPAHRIVRTEDMSYGNVHRLNVRVSVPQHYAKAEIEAIARSVVAEITGQQRVNAISVMFFGPDASTSGAWDVGSVDWAPNGKWGDAGNVRAGDYSTFRYSVNYRPPRQPVSPSSRLEPSGERGLLGAPLPTGAVFQSGNPGDPAGGVDPIEQYEIDAPAAVIAEFFIRELVSAGWSKEGTSTETSLIFRRRGQMLGVFLPPRGGSFGLMGS